MTVEACPHCDSALTNERLPHNTPDDEGVWKCYDCESTFDDPLEREPYVEQQSHNIEQYR